jgi:hypothetical protein
MNDEEEFGREPWYLLDKLWGHLGEQTKAGLPENLRGTIESVLGGE